VLEIGVELSFDSSSDTVLIDDVSDFLDSLSIIELPLFDLLADELLCSHVFERLLFFELLDLVLLFHSYLIRLTLELLFPEVSLRLD